MKTDIRKKIIEYLIRDIYVTYRMAATHFNVSEQYIASWIKTGIVPIRYASYISRKHGIPTYLLNYNDYILLSPLDEKEYVNSIKQHLGQHACKEVLELPLPNRKAIYKENDKRWM